MMKKTPVGLSRQSFQIEGIQISNADKDGGGALVVDGGRKSSIFDEDSIKLPSGDFIISWSPSGFPVITRTPSAKSQCPDRLNLDKQRLTLCPILEGESHLRLLNYQHNLISRIENLGNLTKLIFLDLYDNQISVISGLDVLKSLRVLMLGKNKIKRIESLAGLRKLDVLDLHNNQIVKIENLEQLQDLRVLNLAGNLIRKVENLRGLHSLTELNLRRNLIETVKDCEFLTNLKQLYLSYNMIARFEDIANVALCRSLVEIALDGNPLCQGPCYRIATIKQMPQIKQLDLKRITTLKSVIESENPDSSLAAASEVFSTIVPHQWQPSPLVHTCRSEPAQVIGLSASLSTRRMFAPGVAGDVNSGISNGVPTVNSDGASGTDDERQIANAFKVGNPTPGPVALSAHAETSPSSSKLWHNTDATSSSAPASREQGNGDLSGTPRQPLFGNLQQAAATGTAMPTGSSTLTNGPQSLSKPTTFKIKIPGGVSITQQLDVYDIDSLFKSTHSGVQSPANITTISFNRTNFTSIVPHLGKLKSFYPTLSVICFNECNIQTLVQLASLTTVRRIQNIVIGYVGNPVTSLTYWRQFLAWKTGIHSINGEQVSDSELAKMEQIFGMLPNAPPAGAMGLKMRDYVLKYVRDMRDEAARGVENTSRLRHMQDKLMLDLLRNIGGLGLASMP